MLISRNWLQTFFSDELPAAEVLENALMFHAFEIDGIEQKGDDFILDVKVTPNRGHDCLCHAGIAKELSAILKLRLKSNPFAAAEVFNFAASPLRPAVEKLETSAAVFESTRAAGKPVLSAAGHDGDATKTGFPAAPTADVVVSIDTDLCLRYIAAHIKNIKVGPSPDWLRAHLESIGQRSINNVVDATNYVMFHLGQPLHAFDAGKLQAIDGRYAISVRPAMEGESMLALDEKEYTLNPSMLVITDTNSAHPSQAGVAIGIAGVKGGMPAGITETTTDIILESANFDGVSVRKTAKALKLRTDASVRFEQVMSPELAAHGMREVIRLILDIAGGSVEGLVDIYPIPQKKKTAFVSVDKINQVLGITLTGADISNVFARLGFAYKEQYGIFEVVVPFERLDIEIPEDLIEEVGRIHGYERIAALELPPLVRPLEVNQNFYWAEKIRDHLAHQGFSEVFTSVFAEKGERVVLNKVDAVMPYMRDSLLCGLQDALTRNQRNKDILNVSQIRLFEIGTVWQLGKEILSLGLAVEDIKKFPKVSDFIKDLEEKLCTQKLHLLVPESGPLGKTSVVEFNVSNLVEHLPISNTYDQLPLSPTKRYEPYSKYPYIVRDISIWLPIGTFLNVAERIIKESGGELLNKLYEFDSYYDEKSKKSAKAFRLIFQSFDRTLVEDEVHAVLEKIYTKLKVEGFEIR